MSFRIVVTEVAEVKPNDLADALVARQTCIASEIEIFRQTVPELNLAKFIVALNKAPRGRKAKQPSAS